MKVKRSVESSFGDKQADVAEPIEQVDEAEPIEPGESR